MPDDETTPNYRALMQDLQRAFTQGEEYTLVDAEVMTVYLALVRLKDLEDMAVRRDWAGIAEYNPTE